MSSWPIRGHDLPRPIRGQYYQLMAQIWLLTTGLGSLTRCGFWCHGVMISWFLNLYGRNNTIMTIVLTFTDIVKSVYFLGTATFSNLSFVRLKWPLWSCDRQLQFYWGWVEAEPWKLSHWAYNVIVHQTWVLFWSSSFLSLSAAFLMTSKGQFWTLEAALMTSDTALMT